MVNTRWTPELQQQVRDLAGQGMSARAAAEIMGVTRKAVATMASRHGISFRGNQAPDFEMPDEPRSLTKARAILASEIAAAKQEMATAPLYRKGWPD